MRALIGTTVAGVFFLLAATAHAEPPPPLAVPAAPLAAPPPAAATPPPYGAAPPQYGYAPRPRYPEYFYLPGSLAASPGSPSPQTRVWYGWQTLIALGGMTVVGLSSTFGGVASGNAGFTIAGSVLGGTGLFMSGPIVHWIHGNTAKGFVALGLNFGAPLVGGGLGVAIACGTGACRGDLGGFGVFLGGVFGGGVGLLTSLIVDVSALSYDTKAPGAPSARSKAPPWTLLPDLKITREKTTFGVAGVF